MLVGNRDIGLAGDLTAMMISRDPSAYCFMCAENPMYSIVGLCLIFLRVIRIKLV